MSLPKPIEQFEVSEWQGCYGDGWKGLIVEAAFAHPAKYARGLIRRIYEHAQDEGWLIAGDVVVDPFGGIALGGFDAAMMGAYWIGCELEAKFVELGNENIAEWQHRYGHRPGYGSARLIQGDSRKLSEVLREAGMCVSSPPYADAVNANGEGPGMAGNAAQRKRIYEGAANERAALSREVGYGSTPGNLGNLPATEAGLTLAISSPPYHESLASDNPETRGGLFRDPKRRNDKSLTATYGESDGQLGAMKESSEGFTLAVSSPPYATDQLGGGGNKHDKVIDAMKEGYGEAPGQLGAMRDKGFDLSVRLYRQIKSQYNTAHETFNETATADNGNPANVRRGQERKTNCGRDRGKRGNGKQENTRSGASADAFRRSAGSPSVRTGQACSILAGQDSASGDSREASREGQGQESLQLQRRNGDAGIPEENQEGILRDVRCSPESLRPSQRPGPLQQRSEEPASAVCILPSESAQEDVLGCEESRTTHPEIDGQLPLVVSSPPFEESNAVQGGQQRGGGKRLAEVGDAFAYDDENLGNHKSQDFWSAARQIVEETYKVLAPGAHAIWVVKGFIRAKKYVDFPDQWRQLCEAVGFRTLHWHNASLVEQGAQQQRLDGGTDSHNVERKSFFRRLAESKGSPRIDAEVVLCMEK